MEKSHKKTNTKPICVVLDTNVLVSKLLLKTSMGAALLHNLKRLKGHLGLPEVVERELSKNIVKLGLEVSSKIAENFRTIEILVGRRSSYSLPSEEDLENVVKDRIQEISELTIKIPFKLKHAKKALDRVIEGTPPNNPNNQQFKDSAIWEAVQELSQSYSVYFVTNDKGFFKDRDPSKGLASSLKDEYQNDGFSIIVNYDLKECLESLREVSPPIDLEKMAKSIESLIKDQINKIADEKKFSLGSMIKYQITPFVTEKIDILALNFAISFDLSEQVEPVETERLEPIITAIGECSYNIDKKSASNIRFDTIEPRWLTPDGQVVSPKNIFVRVSDTITIGGKGQVRYSLKEPLGPQK